MPVAKTTMPISNEFANGFAQYDADIQALIAEVETLAPPVATMGRRTFLKLAGFAGGGLVLAFNLDTRRRGRRRSAIRNRMCSTPSYGLRRTIRSRSFRRAGDRPGYQDRVRTDHRRRTGCRLETVKVEQAPINPKVYGYQGAGGSTSIPRGWDQLRQAGATARAC